jgi:hypothetical protein
VSIASDREEYPLPRVLYKYRPLNPHTEQLLLQGEIWCSSPDSFNDPFECRPLIHFDMDDPLTKQWLDRQLLRKNVRGASAKFDVKRRFRHFYKSPRVLSEEANSTRRDTGIYSLAEKRDDLLMWAHYSAQHTGVCIGFDTEYWPFQFAFRVTYSDSYPVVKRATDTGSETVQASLLTKAKCWEYEAEWRVIMKTLDAETRAEFERIDNAVARFNLREHGPGSYTISTKAIAELVFGLRVPSPDKKRIAAAVANTGMHTRMFEARQSDSDFKIEVVPLRP